jgi:N-acetyl-anhydromuramyl-L-alanine amidase AmpD
MSLIVGYKKICYPRVVSWDTHKCFFENVSGREEDPDKIVIHWTAGEGSYKRVFDVLNSRKLSVHFVISRDGTIYQMANTDSCCLHAGAVNNSSIGIEIVNYGFVWKDRKVPTNAINRRTESTKIKGMKLNIADFYNVQICSIKFLVNELTKHIPSIARSVPRKKDGSIYHNLISKDKLAKFSGVIGHYHCSEKKIDPGPKLIETIAQSMV